MTIAARAAGLDVVDGPFVDFKNDAVCRIECQRALTLGMVGKWAIHPSQIEPAIDVFSPSQDDVDFAREIIAVYEKAAADGLGSVVIKGLWLTRHQPGCFKTPSIAPTSLACKALLAFSRRGGFPTSVVR